MRLLINKRLWTLTVLWAITFCLCKAQTPLAFTDYGPTAFESFWRLTPVHFSNNWSFSTFSRWSADRSSNSFFTQYVEISAPISDHNTLIIRTPHHWYNLTNSEASRLGVENTEGSSWGDIDIIFNIRILRSLINQGVRIYLSGEMHTAPTNRNERQFTDTLKMLGMLITQFNIWKTNNHSIQGVLGIGAGGWQDDIVPRQNHIFKLSSQLAYITKIGRNKGLLSIGQTFLSGERDNDQGLLLDITMGYELRNALDLHFARKFLIYNEETEKVTHQYEVGLRYTLP